jgi:hypothetical protein
MGDPTFIDQVGSHGEYVVVVEFETMAGVNHGLVATLGGSLSRLLYGA